MRQTEVEANNDSEASKLDELASLLIMTNSVWPLRWIGQCILVAFLFVGGTTGAQTMLSKLHQTEMEANYEAARAAGHRPQAWLEHTLGWRLQCPQCVLAWQYQNHSCRRIHGGALHSSRPAATRPLRHAGKQRSGLSPERPR